MSSLFIVAHEVMGFEGTFISWDAAIEAVGLLLKEEIDDVAQFDGERARRIERLLGQGDFVMAHEVFMTDPIGHAIELDEHLIDMNVHVGMRLYLLETHPLDLVPGYTIWSRKEARDQELARMEKSFPEIVSAIDAEVFS